MSVLNRNHGLRAAALLLLVAATYSATAAPAHARTSGSKSSGREIQLENRTYSTMWFRYRDAGNEWSDWRKLLPGSRLSFSDRRSMEVDISNDGGARRKYTLASGSAYKYDRATADGVARFRSIRADGIAGPWEPPSTPLVSEFTDYTDSSNMFRPLERFMDRCEARGEKYKLSLKQLAIDCYTAQEQTGTIPKDLRYLRGFTWFFGYVVDKKNEDVILIGVQDPTKPPIDLDCLATAIMAGHFDSTPMCSLDSHPDPKYQKSVVAGVPWETKWAEIMIDADYVMKKVGQGWLEPRISGMPSWFDRQFRTARYSNQFGQTRSENRWWFNFDSSVARSRSSRSGDVGLIFRNPVIVSTENKLNGQYGTGAIDPDSQYFANDFTRNMSTLGMIYPSVAELQAIYRLYDLVYHLKHVGSAEAPLLKYWIDLYKRPYAGPSRVVPTVSRKKYVTWSDAYKKYSLNSTVKGGVLMRLNVGGGALQSGGDDTKVKARLLED